MRALLVAVSLLALALSICAEMAQAGRESAGRSGARAVFAECQGVKGPTRSTTTKQDGGRADAFRGLPQLESRVGRTLVAKLLDWIDTNTDYDVSGVRTSPPAIQFCSLGETIGYEDESLIVEMPLVAAYDSRQRLIYLVEPWDADIMRDVARLLHELIHDVQYRNRIWQCWGNAEREAYRLQERWLISQGEKPDLDWFAINLRTKCIRDIHP